MKSTKQQFMLSQVDKKLGQLQVLKDVPVPPKGWLHTLRTALQMSLRQVSAKASITPQSLKDMASREEAGTINLNTLRDVANAMDMQLVCGFVSKHESLDQMIEKRAKELAIWFKHRLVSQFNICVCGQYVLFSKYFMPGFL